MRGVGWGRVYSVLPWALRSPQPPAWLPSLQPLNFNEPQLSFQPRVFKLSGDERKGESWRQLGLLSSLAARAVGALGIWGLGWAIPACPDGLVVTEQTG